MQRNIIIIGGGTLQVPLIETILGMGLNPCVFDMSMDAPGMKLAGRAIKMSTRDIDGCVREARLLHNSVPIHGVITAGTDASRAVAAIAGALELPGIRYADAEAASNKVLMRKRLRKHGVPVPDFYPVWSVKEAREAMDELQFPLVIKPADNMGARGVIKIERREDIYAAFRHARRNSPTGEMILEEYMPGPELSIDALSWNDGRARLITGIADRIIAREPYFIELGHNMPSAMTPDILEQASAVMFAAMDALGLHTGAAKGDLKVTPDGIKIGEVAARLSGGYMSSHTYPMHSGVNVLRAAVQICMGAIPDGLEPVRSIVAIERGIICNPGKIISISGVEQARQVAGVQNVILTRGVNEIIPSMTSNVDKAGHIIATGETLVAAEQAAALAREQIEILVDDAYSIEWKQVEEQARIRFTDQVCWVCKVCDGTNCASGVPGMGGVGNMTTFQENSRALQRLKIQPQYIRNELEMVSTAIELFGHSFDMPIMAAPMTGAVTNMKGAVSEYDFALMILRACRSAGSIGWVGDGASPEKFDVILKALEQVDGFGVAILKPRADDPEMVRRFQLAEERNVLAVGMDIDAISFKTMRLRNQRTAARGVDRLKQLREATNLPFVLKGVMTPSDAEAAIAAGVDVIVVSNHGGRVLDDMPGTADVLPGIVRQVKCRIPVLVDGGIRSGRDVFKMLALGAN
ncbi:MAG: alpha-hydroxy-acid oxidizing protein, partial [Leptospiraceae bacterium]|nr:alpha-hydroxy-acid oxidizing protein [Leptospiraceae bacterium]